MRVAPPRSLYVESGPLLQLVSRETLTAPSLIMRTNVSRITALWRGSRAVAHMALPTAGTSCRFRHVAAPRANPCARGIDRNNKEGRGRFRHPAARPCAARQTVRGIRKHAERRRGTRPRRPARNASARQRLYVPSRNACAYFITVERFSERKNEQAASFLPLANECFT